MREKDAFQFFTAKELKPQGWLRAQLETQARGLSGHLDKVWLDIRESRWVGGDREGWERVPYWLDGFIPLAWLLDDADLQARATRYVDAILAGQAADGWICPCTPEERRDYDLWGVFLVCKVLVVYQDCTGDERIEEAVYRALKNLYAHLDRRPLFDWAAARWFECLIPLFWLWDRRPEEWMKDLAHLLKIMGFDYNTLFGSWRFQEPADRWNQATHVVNLAMALRSHALYSRLSGEDPEALAKTALDHLTRDHGTAYGHFTGDECLSGDSPIQGSELCSVVEAMYSYEWLYAISGNPFWADRLELLAYNALPATISPDMWTHQYDQMANQIQCSPLPEEAVHFRSNNGEAHLFGLEPHFGCCTANFSQGWPKLALSALLQAEDGIAVGAIAPASVRTVIQGVAVTVTVETEYPFRDSYRVRVQADQPVRFRLYLRAPANAVDCRVDGQAVPPGELHALEREWTGETVVEVAMTFAPVLEPRPRNLFCVRRGPLVYAVKMEEKWVKREYERDGVERRFPYCDYEVLPQSPWNYGFADATLSEEWLERFPVAEQPFSPEHAPLRLQVPLYPIPWQEKNGVCAVTPDSAIPCGEKATVTMIPYGCTNLRMTELPLAEQADI
ncbi:glycoside hydrolase family 127 protein [Ruminococcaceae bacterium OttesenSCG-928-L11]|nr:glycoside hydrolase family 127 protein [Ruminococcaceae bacterium OttesenSCG-928-L11]